MPFRSRSNVVSWMVIGVPVMKRYTPLTFSPPVFGTGVTVVTLPVFVTDKDGKAVTGLTADDFEVQDEGARVKIVGLQEIDAAQPLPIGLTQGSALAARRQFLLLFDLSFTSLSGLVRSRDAAKDFVRKGLLPSDLAAYISSFGPL